MVYSTPLLINMRAAHIKTSKESVELFAYFLVEHNSDALQISWQICKSKNTRDSLFLGESGLSIVNFI